jgi:tetratricopeptide (TPR) repeat protein
VIQELTEERWRRLQALFHAARELPPEDRAHFIDREAGDDLDLSREVEEMLASAGTASEFLEKTVKRVAAQAGARNRLEGRRMGPYRLIREIGRGGMGVVFEARRDDDEYRKTVALKMAPEWRDLHGLAERFRHERQILAGLEHPSIARFLDGGSEAGVPYFAMEYVEGSPITTYCRERKLALRERIELFRQVCAAVHYAHEHLVIHRDLKPANILVGADGVPKLLDFGIAKLLTPGEGDTVGMRLWTPDYTSPEQVRGGPVTTRTDVYSLGLILYEMLCGGKAQNADVSTPLTLDNSICEAAPPAPSRQATERGERALARQLQGDLDIIVAMAIRKEPERRYPSAAALSDDLRRYLQGMPVEARPGTLAYRAAKMIRRHRAAVAAAAVVALSITGGGLAAVYQARRAERRYQQVRKLADSVLFGVHDRIEHLAGATEAREWAVRTALEYLDDLAKDAGSDRSVLRDLASAYLKVGDVQGYPVRPNLGHPDAALVSYRKSLSLAQRLAARDSSTPVRRLQARGHQRVGAMMRVFRKTDAAIEELQKALGLADPLYAAQPGNPEDSEILGSILMALGQAEAAHGNLAEASRLWVRGEEVSTRWMALHPSDEARSQLGRTHRMVTRSLLYTGDLERAEAIARADIRKREELVAGQPSNTAFRRDLMNSYGELAFVFSNRPYLSLGDGREAAVYDAKALTIARPGRRRPEQRHGAQ